MMMSHLHVITSFIHISDNAMLKLKIGALPVNRSTSTIHGVFARKLT